jgi:hypothetical protein
MHTQVSSLFVHSLKACLREKMNSRFIILVGCKSNAAQAPPRSPFQSVTYHRCSDFSSPPLTCHTNTQFDAKRSEVALSREETAPTDRLALSNG